MAAPLLAVLAGATALARPGPAHFLPSRSVSRVTAVSMLGEELTSSLSATAAASSAAWTAAVGAGSDAWNAAWAASSTGASQLPSELASNPNVLAAGISALAIVAARPLLANQGSKKRVGAPYLPGPNTYDPKLADEFYAKRLLFVIGRLLRLGWLTTNFNVRLLLDWQARAASTVLGLWCLLLPFSLFPGHAHT